MPEYECFFPVEKNGNCGLIQWTVDSGHWAEEKEVCNLRSRAFRRQGVET
jgi:hypothetical protein